MIIGFIFPYLVLLTILVFTSRHHPCITKRKDLCTSFFSLSLGGITNYSFLPFFSPNLDLTSFYRIFWNLHHSLHSHNSIHATNHWTSLVVRATWVVPTLIWQEMSEIYCTYILAIMFSKIAESFSLYPQTISEVDSNSIFFGSAYLTDL